MEYNKTPLISFYVDGEYTSKAVKGLMKGREFLLKESLIELEDDLIGLIDEPSYLYFLDWVKGNDWVKASGSDAANANHQVMLMYWNFLLQRE